MQQGLVPLGLQHPGRHGAGVHRGVRERGDGQVQGHQDEGVLHRGGVCAVRNRKRRDLRRELRIPGQSVAVGGGSQTTQELEGHLQVKVEDRNHELELRGGHPQLQGTNQRQVRVRNQDPEPQPLRTLPEQRSGEAEQLRHLHIAETHLESAEDCGDG